MRRAGSPGVCPLCTEPYEGGEWVVPVPHRPDALVLCHLDCARHVAGRGRLKPSPAGELRQVQPPGPPRLWPVFSGAIVVYLVLAVLVLVLLGALL